MYNHKQKIKTASVLASSLLACQYANAGKIQHISAQVLNDNTTEIKLIFEKTVVPPKAYKTDNPNKLILDFKDTKNLLKRTSYNLTKSQQIKSINAVSNTNVTRIVFNLKGKNGFTTKIVNNTLVLKVQSSVQKSHESKRNSRPKSSSYRATKNPLLDMNIAKNNQKKFSVVGLSNVNFRKTDGNTGRIDIALANPNIPVDVQRKGSKIHVRMLGAKVPKRLRRRMNVSNFNTPVRNIDAFNDGSNGTLVIQPKGEFDYQVYQTDSNLTIEVSPIVKVSDPRPKAKTYTGKPLTLDFQDVEVRAVLQLLADFTDLNLIAGDDVGGRMTLRLHNVPWDQALDIILKSKALGMRKSGNVILIAPANKLAEQDEQIITSQNKIKALAPIRTEYIELNYAKASDLLKLIGKNSGGKSGSSLLSKRGTVSQDDRTNTLIIQDTATKIDEIRGLISKLDVPVKQVMIEARIVRASDSFSKELGVKWGMMTGSAASNPNFIMGGSDQTLWNLKEYEIETKKINGKDQSFAKYTIDTPDNLNVDLGVNSAGASKVAFGLLSLPGVMLDLELSALQADGRGEVVATPKVLTADKQTAIVASGTQLPYEKSTASGATAIAFINAELSLEVTPSITPEGKVAMKLNITSNSPGELLPNGMRAIDTNRVNTNVLVDDGQTVVLGGIFQNQTTNSVAKTPFLGDLPYVGRFFRKTQSKNSKQELLIFVTPKLINENINNVSNK